MLQQLLETMWNGLSYFVIIYFTYLILKGIIVYVYRDCPSIIFYYAITISAAEFILLGLYIVLNHKVTGNLAINHRIYSIIEYGSLFIPVVGHAIMKIKSVISKKKEKYKDD